MEYCLEFFKDIENLLKDTLRLGVRISNCFVILTYDTKYLSMQRKGYISIPEGSRTLFKTRCILPLLLEKTKAELNDSKGGDSSFR